MKLIRINNNNILNVEQIIRVQDSEKELTVYFSNNSLLEFYNNERARLLNYFEENAYFI